jgi:hypothetical protein
MPAGAEQSAHALYVYLSNAISRDDRSQKYPRRTSRHILPNGINSRLERVNMTRRIRRSCLFIYIEMTWFFHVIQNATLFVHFIVTIKKVQLKVNASMWGVANPRCGSWRAVRIPA